MDTFIKFATAFHNFIITIINCYWFIPVKILPSLLALFCEGKGTFFKHVWLMEISHDLHVFTKKII